MKKKTTNVNLIIFFRFHFVFNLQYIVGV